MRAKKFGTLRIPVLKLFSLYQLSVSSVVATTAATIRGPYAGLRRGIHFIFGEMPPRAESRFAA